MLAVMEYLGKNFTTIKVCHSKFSINNIFLLLKFYCNTSDGYVKVEDLLSLRKEHTEKDVRKSVEYSFSDKLDLKEGPPLMIKLAFRQVRCFMTFHIPTTLENNFYLHTHSIWKVPTQIQELTKYLGN